MTKNREARLNLVSWYLHDVRAEGKDPTLVRLARSIVSCKWIFDVSNPILIPEMRLRNLNVGVWCAVSALRTDGPNISQLKGGFTHSMQRPCRSPAMPCC
jgi:hypothetical protein